jgi:hypothetical protein
MLEFPRFPGHLDPPTDVGAAASLRAADRAKSSPAWRYAEIETTHMAASNRPKELAAVLLELAPGPCVSHAPRVSENGEVHPMTVEPRGPTTDP